MPFLIPGVDYIFLIVSVTTLMLYFRDWAMGTPGTPATAERARISNTTPRDGALLRSAIISSVLIYIVVSMIFNKTERDPLKFIYTYIQSNESQTF